MGAVRNFFWKITTPRAIRTLETFCRLAVVRGLHHNEVLEEVLEQYNQRYIKDFGLTNVQLVDEVELLSRLDAEAKLKVSHTLLMKYKRENQMPTGGDEPLFYSNGVRVVYNFELCRDWFEQKLAAS